MHVFYLYSSCKRLQGSMAKRRHDLVAIVLKMAAIKAGYEVKYDSKDKNKTSYAIEHDSYAVSSCRKVGA